MILFLGQSFRGCMSNSSHSRNVKTFNLTHNNELAQKDSIIVIRELTIKDLEGVLTIAQDEIKNLGYELKIAGVKVDAAKERADAIQRTADKIKQNTTIEIKADTTRNKITQ